MRLCGRGRNGSSHYEAVCEAERIIREGWTLFLRSNPLQRLVCGK